MDILNVSAGDIVDTHICGACRTEFHNVELFLLHKRQSCPVVLLSAATQKPPDLQRSTEHRTHSRTVHNLQIQQPSHLVNAVTTSRSSVVHQPPQVIQDETIPTSIHTGEEAGEGPAYMITPPQGHEYIQTSLRQQSFVRGSLGDQQAQILLSDKGEMIVIQTDNSSKQDLNPHNQAIANLIQQLKATQGGAQDVASSIISIPEIQNSGHGDPNDKTPRMQLDHNNSFSLIPNSQLPVNLQLPSNQTPAANVVSESADTVQARQGVLYQTEPSDSSIPVSTGIHDLAQQAAQLSGVVNTDMHPVTMDMTSVETPHLEEQIVTNHYSVDIRNLSHNAGSDNVGTILQIPESNTCLQDGMTPVQNCISQAAVDSQIIGNNNGVMMAENEMVLNHQATILRKNKSRSTLAKNPSKSQNKSLADKKSTQSKTKPAAKRYKCTVDDCIFSTPYMKDLERHMRTHTGEKPFSCTYCDKAFSRIDKLRLHIRSHTGDKPYKCSLCSYCAVDSSSLRKHQIVHTDERPYQCQVCPYSCRNQSQLTVHLRTHTGDCPFPCPFCPSKFKIKSDLRRHVRVHTGEKPYPCDKCDVRCATKGNLVSHMKIHHCIANQVKCSECSFVTSSKKSLREHVKEHDYVDPECVCPVCKYKCANKEVLKNHAAMHDPEKQHKCNLCHFTTRYRANLLIHMKRRHVNVKPNIKPGPKSYKEREEKDRKGSGTTGKYTKLFECHICPESFVRKDSLRSHLRLHEERAKSTLSTALAVLKLQQPVINSATSTSVKPGSDKNAPQSRYNVVSNATRDSVPTTVKRNKTRSLSKNVQHLGQTTPNISTSLQYNNQNVDEIPVVYAVSQAQPVSTSSAVLSSEVADPNVANSSNNGERQFDLNYTEYHSNPPVKNYNQKQQGLGDVSERHILKHQMTNSSKSNEVSFYINRGDQNGDQIHINGLESRIVNNESVDIPSSVRNNEQETVQTGTDNSTGSFANNTPVPQVCSLSNLQLFQNVSFPLPLLRLPTGQIISTYGAPQLTSQVLGPLPNQKQNGEQIVRGNEQSVEFVNSSIQSQEETPIQHPLHTVPLQLLSQPTNDGSVSMVTEGVAQMVDAAGNSIPTTIQLVIPTSMGTDSLGQLPPTQKLVSLMPDMSMTTSTENQIINSEPSQQKIVNSNVPTNITVTDNTVDGQAGHRYVSLITADSSLSSQNALEIIQHQGQQEVMNILPQVVPHPSQLVVQGNETSNSSTGVSLQVATSI